MKQLISTFVIFTLYLSASSTLYEKGINALEEKHTTEAIQYFKEASKNENAKAMYKLGLIYEQDDNTTEAIEWYKKAKSAGNIKAQYSLGVLSCKMKTYNFLDDFENYAKESTKSVQYDLAVCFSQKGEHKKALKWFTVVAKKGDAKAQYRVATLVTSKNSKLKWLKKSAQNNHKEAQFELGKTLFKAHKLQKAKDWLKKAKENGSKKATVYLKRMKELGL